MYKLRITTPYTTIHLLVDDVNSPDVQEIMNEPWVKHVEYELCDDNMVVDTRYKRLVKAKYGVNNL